MTDQDELERRLSRLGEHLEAERLARATDALTGPGSSPAAGSIAAKDATPPRPHGASDLGTSGRPLRLRLVAAAVGVAALTGLGYFFVVGDSSETSAVNTVDTVNAEDTVNTEDTVNEDAVTEESDGGVTVGTAPSGDGAGAQASDSESDSAVAVPVPDLADIMVNLPAQVDLDGGAMVYVGEEGMSPEKIAEAYLGDRLPELPVSVRAVESDDNLTLLRWQTGPETELFDSAAGSVVVRNDLVYLPGVVLATTDGVAVTSAVRSDTALMVAAEAVGDLPDPADESSGMFTAEVVTTAGDLVTGSTPGNVVQVDMPDDGAVAALVRISHQGGTRVSITEFALDPVGFAEPCGSNPPVSIDVGRLLGALTEGPAPLSERDALVNQRVWHHPGEAAFIEIRWPADPAISSRLTPDDVDSADVISFQTYGDPQLVPDSAIMLALVGQSAVDPCAVVQISVYGDPAAVEWWGTALSGQWSFGFPLSIADLDPIESPYENDGGRESDAGSDGSLIVATEVVSDPPAVLERGSCDGLPDAPPKTGLGLGTISESAPEALLAFVAEESSVDPPLPVSGYTEFPIGEDHITYAVVDGDRAIVVVEVSAVDGGWIVEEWSAAAC
ncbi:MAG: hypothetical protein ACRBK7_13235 [Acidimicrobiales bacterium]